MMDTTTDELAHLDEETVGKLRDIGARMDEGTFVTNLLNRFLQGTPERLRALQAAVAESDCEALEFQAHTLKSSCGYVGATVMVEVCQALESLGRAGETDDAGRLLSQLQESFALVTSALEELLADLGDAPEHAAPGAVSRPSTPG